MSESNRKRGTILACIVIAAATALMGCRSEEQNRIMRFEKGTYLGKPDQNLSDEQVNELRHRARAQEG
ncbi:MAG: hypothetical protein JSU82_02415 [Rhodospirillales bacterium]|nr:MAG: hypothetical protein JSU82_02415 [Rhodospirillales bacterium]